MDGARCSSLAQSFDYIRGKRILVAKFALDVPGLELDTCTKGQSLLYTELAFCLDAILLSPDRR
jgi:hypothetical protein